MIFEAKVIRYPLIDKYLEKSWKELVDFFEFTPKFSPKIFILEDRKSIDAFMERKTEKWAKNGCIRGNIFLLNPEKYSQVTDRDFDPKRFYDSVIHELCHHFYAQIVGHDKPKWINEGTALYFGTQLKFHKTPTQFHSFLKFYQTSYDDKDTVYNEAGFVIDKLIKKFGKAKLLELIKNIRNVKSEDDFSDLFNRTFGLNLNYDNINKL
jgi:hypothetical protein